MALKQYDMKGAYYDGTLTLNGVSSTYGFDLKQLLNVKFTWTGDLQENNHKLALMGIRTTVNDVTLLDNNIAYLHFNYPVDPALAKNSENDVIDGAQVESAVVEAASLTSVKLTLKPDSNTFTGERNMTIKGLKATNSVEQSTDITSSIHLKENLTPKIATAYVTDRSTITLVLTEEVSTISSTDFIVMLDGATIANVTYKSTEPKTVLIYISESGKRREAGQKVTIQQFATNAIQDLSGNKLDSAPQVNFVPSTIR